MNYQDKTKEELIAELLELRLENRKLKQFQGKNITGNVPSFSNDKQGSNDFRGTKEYYELMFNTSPDASLVTRLADGMVVEMNDGFTKFTGFTGAEIIGTTTNEVELWKNPEDRQLFVNELLENGFSENFEGTFVRKNGSTLIGLISAKTFMLNGEPHIFSIVRDITKQKQSEENLRRSEEKFRNLYANMIDGSALHTLVYNDQGVPDDYLIIEVNPAFESQLGISREKVINKTSRVAYGVDDPPYFEIYSKVALTGIPEVFETYFAPLEKHFSIAVYCPFKGSFATIFENITERRKAEQGLRVILAKYQVLFDIFPIGITISDETGKIIESNQIAETFLGISHEEQEKRTIDAQEWQIIRPDGSTMPASEFASVRALAENRPVTNVEMGIVKGNNLVNWLNVSATPIPIEGYGVAIVYSDMTVRKHIESELKIKNEQLKELNATKDKFFSIIAHDLKSPFNTILGFSGILKSEAHNLDIDSIVKYTEIINSSAKNTFKLLENLLDWARMQQGGFHFEPKKLLINNLIINEFEVFKYNADQKSITLINCTSEETIINADEIMLGTVLRNLISNAIKFTPKNGLVKVEAEKKTDRIQISISDTGVGMEKETIGKLFELETSFTTRGTENEKGSGLGLLLCKEFVEIHGGRIWVESEKGKGSRFIFAIPN